MDNPTYAHIHAMYTYTNVYTPHILHISLKPPCLSSKSQANHACRPESGASWLRVVGLWTWSQPANSLCSSACVCFHLCCLYSLALAALMEDIEEAEPPDTPATASQKNPLQVSKFYAPYTVPVSLACRLLSVLLLSTFSHLAK